MKNIPHAGARLIGSISEAAFNFMVQGAQGNHGMVQCQSFSSQFFNIPHHSGFLMIGIEYSILPNTL